MKILVTGGAGFIGSHLVDKLIEKKHQVAVVDNLSTGKRSFVNAKAKFYKTSVTNPKLKAIFNREKPEIVFHLAAQKSVPFSLTHPLEDATINIWGSLKVIENCLRLKVKKFIFMSTGGAIYGQTRFLPWSESAPQTPLSPYGLSKLTVDNYLLNYYGPLRKLNFICLRPANVYGPRQDPSGEAGVIAIFVNNLLHHKKCYLNGTGVATRDYIYVSDIVEAAVKVIGKGRGVYNLGTGKETSVKFLYHLIAGLISPVKPEFRPAIAGEVLRSALKSIKAKKDLSWEPEIDLINGIKKTIEYFK
ncbi:MAG: NAD-dependent epimerase/dehydratase family protein [Candidatus Komeilibacteria bacterium]|nr:NAD-dependent epimerase/dehydratase family protein [Candidatus Komeilibacteria bacterium]